MTNVVREIRISYVQSRKSLSCLITKMKLLHLNVRTRLPMFDTYIENIANHGSEANELQSIHSKFHNKKKLDVKKSTVSMMVNITDRDENHYTEPRTAEC